MWVVDVLFSERLLFARNILALPICLICEYVDVWNFINVTSRGMVRCYENTHMSNLNIKSSTLHATSQFSRAQFSRASTFCIVRYGDVTSMHRYSHIPSIHPVVSVWGPVEPSIARIFVLYASPSKCGIRSCCLCVWTCTNRWAFYARFGYRNVREFEGRLV